MNKKVCKFIFYCALFFMAACSAQDKNFSEIERYYENNYADSVASDNFGKFDFYASKVKDPRFVYVSGKKKTALKYAADKQEKRIAERILDKNPEIMKEPDNSWTPLMWAIRMGYVKLAKRMIDSGADVNAKDFLRRPILTLAIQRCMPLSVFEKMFSKGAVIDSDKTIETAVSCNCNYKVVEFLYNKSKEQNVPQKIESVILAVLENDKDSFCEYIKKQDGKMKLNSNFEYAYRMCAGLGRIEFIDCFKQYGFSLNENPSGNHDSLLSIAAENNQLETVKYLVESENVDVNKMAYGSYAIMKAIQNNDYEIVKYLLDHGANKFNGPGDMDFNLMTYPIGKNSNYEMAKLLIPYDDSNKKIDQRMINDEAPHESLKFYLENGYELDYDDLSFFPNYFISDSMSFDFYKLLLDKYVDKISDKKYDYGPSLYLYNNSNTDKLEYFFSKVNYEVPVYEIKNAIWSYNYDIFKIYAEHRNLTKDEFQELLICAAQVDDDKFVEYLVSHGANINLADKDGRTPLMISFMAKKYMPAKKLIELGADIGLKDNNGKNAKYYAKKTGYKFMVNLL